MQADFAVVNQAAFAFVDEFNRVFQGDDVIFAIGIAVIHHRRQRRGLAGTGRAGDEDEAAVQHAKLLEHRGQRRIELFKIFKGQDPARNLPEHGTDADFLIEKIYAEARDVRDFVTEVHVTGFFDLFDFVIRSDFVKQGLERVVFERGIIHPLKFAVDAQHGRVAGGHMQVGRLLLKH